MFFYGKQTLLKEFALHEFPPICGCSRQRKQFGQYYVIQKKKKKWFVFL